MPAPKVSEKEFIWLCKTLKSPTQVSKRVGCTLRAVQSRMTAIESRLGMLFEVSDTRSNRSHSDTNPARLVKELKDGVIVVGSDAHYYPNCITTAHKAMIALIRELKPRTIVMNGDVFDGSTISRWPRIGWQDRPSVDDELKACTERLAEITDAAPRAEYVWPLGNHDARFETFLASRSPEYEGVSGFTLKDRFPEWKPCWSYFVNDNTVIKHRFKGGIHATHNNALWSGRTIVTGHLHSLKVTPFSDYNGTRYGVDTGTLADPDSETFVDYTEDSPKNWRSGFAVLTYHKGYLLPPEVCEVTPLGAIFRGRVICQHG